MFDAIAGRYRLMNSIMTFGRDGAWRRRVVAEARLPAGGRLLDIATGTGDIAFEALSGTDGLRAVGADFSREMMEAGRRQPGGDRVLWCRADALDLPFAEKSFDAVTSGYLLRNVPDQLRAFREQVRVLKPGGRVVCLDTTPPRASLLRPLILMHLRYVIPLLGRIVSGDGAAYSYLASSTEGFKTAEELADLMEEAGLVDVTFHRFMFGTMAIHAGTKRAD
jgi:demethylmenaquinone methyltransferase/2-methoxy-6-polyprenyl-1,4-benzoquinol methylase